MNINTDVSASLGLEINSTPNADLNQDLLWGTTNQKTQNQGTAPSRSDNLKQTGKDAGTRQDL